jgi:hypothetical protein
VRLHAFAGVLVTVLVPNDAVAVVLSLLLGVQVVEPLERVDRDDDVAGARVGGVVLVTLLEVVQDASLG